MRAVVAAIATLFIGVFAGSGVASAEPTPTVPSAAIASTPSWPSSVPVFGTRTRRHRPGGPGWQVEAQQPVGLPDRPRGRGYRPHGVDAQVLLRHPVTPTAIIRSCLTATRLISSSAAGSPASSMASAMTIIALTNRLARMLRSSLLQSVQPGEAGQVDGQLRGDQPDLGADRVAQHRHPARPFAADEPPVLAALVDSRDEDVDRGLDDPVGVELAGSGAAQHVPQCAEGLVDQHEAERFHRLEVPVERGWDDAGLPGDLTQAQRAEAAVLEQAQRGGDDRAAGGLLALLPGRVYPANATDLTCAYVN